MMLIMLTMQTMLIMLTMLTMLMILTMLTMLMMLMRPTQVNALAGRRRETRLLAGKRPRWVGSP